MTLLISRDALARRREIARGPLAALTASLRADLEPIVQTSPEIPEAKALLSRDGGRCPRDSATLAFDPFSPDSHRCPVCGTMYGGERHHRWWVTFRQLWLAERAVHAALLFSVTGETALRAAAAGILEGYSARYLTYPNRDNVLGPTRPFFSTYLESIWLLQLCIAVDLLESSGAIDQITSTFRERVIEPSARLIASYDEGASNRQVWNNAALIAANLLLGRSREASRAVTGASGLISHLDGGLLGDGTWYEGENYHLFAHRGLWYGVMLADNAAIELPAKLVERFDEGFATPLATALPDFTFPSRRDSQYGITLRQWRFAESCELGLARHTDPRLLGALWELYENPPRDRGGSIGVEERRRVTGRWRSTAESERNEPPTHLTRADLSWRSLLIARAELPLLEPNTPESTLLEEQGFGVIRRDHGRVYVALDYGHSGGGHGHPDRLNLLLVNGEQRWLDDMGTGSYVDRSLHWYRSTLAHNAPLVDGRSQARAHGLLRAFDERGGAGWIAAEIPSPGIAPGVAVSRAVVVMPDYLVDQLTWEAPRNVSIDLPIHLVASIDGVGQHVRATPGGGQALEDGFPFLRETMVATSERDAPVHLRAVLGSDVAEAWSLTSGESAEWWRAEAPGAPGKGDKQFHFVRVAGLAGSVTTVWSWCGAVRAVTWHAGALHVQLSDDSRHVHTRRGWEWHAELFAGGARSSIDLAGIRAYPRRETPPVSLSALTATLVPASQYLRPNGEPTMYVLAEREYRPSEISWRDAGAPRADVGVGVRDDDLVVRVEVTKTPVLFRGRDATDPALDNEHPDIHSDGVQFYLMSPSWAEPAAWMIVPERAQSRPRLREIDGSRTGVSLSATWSETASGYEIRLSVPLQALGGMSPLRFSLDVIVNDMAPDRERRRGQLVLSGGAGEFVYLRGDRHDAGRFLHFIAKND
ncbi:MAG: heparinase II/III family protein [Anaerolineae bacterium]|nr:heparinase II/III family protein [Gemmatimonadaceae bacterium]